MKVTLAVAAVALTLPAAAAAHVSIEPPFVEQGVRTVISFETPNERPPHATTSLSVRVPSDITIVKDMAPRGWSSTVAGSLVTWSGGRLEGRGTALFSIRIMAEGRAGTSTFQALQTYDDGETVEWTADLSVLPGARAPTPKEHPWGAVAAGLAGLAVIAGSLVGLRVLRRRSLQDR